MWKLGLAKESALLGGCTIQPGQLYLVKEGFNDILGEVYYLKNGYGVFKTRFEILKDKPIYKLVYDFTNT